MAPTGCMSWDELATSTLKISKPPEAEKVKSTAPAAVPAANCSTGSAAGDQAPMAVRGARFSMAATWTTLVWVGDEESEVLRANVNVAARVA